MQFLHKLNFYKTAYSFTATFESKFGTKNFQKSPNLVTLLSTTLKRFKTDSFESKRKGIRFKAQSFWPKRRNGGGDEATEILQGHSIQLGLASFPGQRVGLLQMTAVWAVSQQS